MHRIVHLQEGLVLVTGPTGSGKSYTLATCLQCINDECHKHIITLEDPIEFTFENNQSLIHQRNWDKIWNQWLRAFAMRYEKIRM